MLTGFLDEEKSGLRVHCGHLVIFGFRDLDHRLLQHLADRVDRDIDTAHRRLGVCEQLLVRAGCGEVGLEGEGFRAGSLDRGYRLVGRRLGGAGVVVDSDRFRARSGEIARDQPAEVLRATGDENGFSLDAVIGHLCCLLGACIAVTCATAS